MGGFALAIAVESPQRPRDFGGARTCNEKRDPRRWLSGSGGNAHIIHGFNYSLFQSIFRDTYITADSIKNKPILPTNRA